MLRFPQLKCIQMLIIFLHPKSSVALDFSGFLWYNLRVVFMILEVSSVIKRGKMRNKSIYKVVEKRILGDNVESMLTSGFSTIIGRVVG